MPPGLDGRGQSSTEARSSRRRGRSHAKMALGTRVTFPPPQTPYPRDLWPRPQPLGSLLGEATMVARRALGTQSLLH